MKKVILVILFVAVVILQIHSREGKRVGAIGRVLSKGKIEVKGPLIGKKVTMGKTLYVRIKGEIVKMCADLPMGAMVKCTLHRKYRKYAKYIKKGTPVYIYRKGLNKEDKKDKYVHGETKKIGGIEFVYIKGGTFMMGSNDGKVDEKPVHKVKVSSFWMGKYEVTRKQYKDIMGENNSSYIGKLDRDPSVYPVDMIEWNDAMKFCKKFSRKNKIKVRLPYEAEWEYAARAGSTTKYYWGDKDDFKTVNKYAVYNENRNDQDGANKIGTKKPNKFGLYDMSGNVWEWCMDWYDNKYYRNSPKKNPKGPLKCSKTDTYDDGRVNRGGCWDYDSKELRSANRLIEYGAEGGWGLVGFRLLFEK
jgi:formylglycine-generating enzyme required for sulfatase activity